MAGGGPRRLASVADHHAFPIDEHSGPRKGCHRQHRGPGLGADCRAWQPTSYLAVSATRPAGDPAALCRRLEHVRGDSRFPAGRQAACARTFQPQGSEDHTDSTSSEDDRASLTVDELQTKLGAGVGPYVMMWARDGFLIKADRDASPGASWRYRLLRDNPEHPPVG
jgi:hypothetical protein